MRIKPSYALLSAIGLACSSQAFAKWEPLDERLATYRPYLTAGAGAAVGKDSEDTVGLIRLGAGIKVGRHVAVEVNYMKVGAFSESNDNITLSDISARDASDGPTQGAVINSRSLSLQGVGIGLVGYLPLGDKTRLIVRTDVHRMSQKEKQNGFEGDFDPIDPDPAKPITKLAEIRNNDTVNYYGVGAGVERKVGRNTFVRAQGEFYGTSYFGGDKGEDFYTLNIQLMQRL